MTKKKETKKKDVEALEIEEVKEDIKEEVIVEDIKEEVEELNILEPVVVKAKHDYTKVIPMEDIKNVYIGGKYYNFTKNVEQRVLTDVERVLRERDLIK